MNKKSFTLVELVISLAVFLVLFTAVLALLTNSNNSWKRQQGNLTSQAQARKLTNEVGRILRQANAQWLIGGVTYSAVISDSNQRIDFYAPVFNGSGAITQLNKITFKLDPTDTTRLLKKEGSNPAVIVANGVSSISFNGGCANCTSYTCTTVDVTCPVVKLSVTTHNQNDFSLDSEVTLRNRNSNLDSSVSVSEPPAGEF
ncbi:MAG: type II secretion system GspH family protein [Candidatus Omnitrophica bacterium]|jgi:type II secretory pathway pseudopilin PulG|nr:type II secretion system GspH family protein [Candidatus Omnitrophota bacterium]